jgi:hypothetical protein
MPLARLSFFNLHPILSILEEISLILLKLSLPTTFRHLLVLHQHRR